MGTHGEGLHQLKGFASVFHETSLFHEYFKCGKYLNCMIGRISSI